VTSPTYLRRTLENSHRHPVTEEQRHEPGAAPAAFNLVREIIALGPAILDQGVWSMAGFVSAALVARLLGAEALAIFTIGTSIIFAVGAVVNSLILDPAAVIGPRDHEDQLYSYGGLLVSGSAVFGAVTAVPGLVILALFPGEWGAVVSASLICSLPVLLAWAARRLPYLTSQPLWAFWGSCAYLVVVVSTMIVAFNLDVLTPSTAVIALGLGGVAQATVILPLWRPRFTPSTDRKKIRGVAREHWRFGSWYLAAEASSWILNYGLAAISAAVIDLTSAGAFRASQVLLRPYGIVFVGIGLAFLPRLTRIRRDRGHIEAEVSVRRVAWLLSGVGAAVFVVLLGAGGEIMRLVFGPEFAEYGWLVATLAGAMILHGWTAAYSMGLRASNRPKDAFLGQAASAITSLVAGVALGLAWGLVGFAAAFVLASVARLLVVWRLWGRVGEVEPE